jgi:hypothetical protein
MEDFRIDAGTQLPRREITVSVYKKEQERIVTERPREQKGEEVDSRKLKVQRSMQIRPWNSASTGVGQVSVYIDRRDLSVLAVLWPNRKAALNEIDYVLGRSTGEEDFCDAGLFEGRDVGSRDDATYEDGYVFHAFFFE